VNILTYKITAHLSQAAPVKSVRIVRNKDTQRSRGLAYVEFHTDADRQKVLSEKNNSQLDGFTLSIEVSKPPPMQPQKVRAMLPFMTKGQREERAPPRRRGLGAQNDSSESRPVAQEAPESSGLENSIGVVAATAPKTRLIPRNVKRGQPPATIKFVKGNSS